MSSEDVLPVAVVIVFFCLSVGLILSIDQYFKAVDERRDKFHKTLDAWQSRRLADAAETEAGDE